MQQKCDLSQFSSFHFNQNLRKADGPIACISHECFLRTDLFCLKDCLIIRRYSTNSNIKSAQKLIRSPYMYSSVSGHGVGLIKNRNYVSFQAVISIRFPVCFAITSINRIILSSSNPEETLLDTKSL